MSLSFADLKNRRKDNQEKLKEEVSKLNAPKYQEEDDRLWYPNTDKSGNGYAVIRFLPAAKGEDIPFVRVFAHSYQGDNKSWLIENCPTTIAKECPVCEGNTKLWNSGVEEDKKTASKQKRKVAYISNIYVVKDPANPENEGKVFLFKYGKKIWDKINDKMNPPEEFEDLESINPFDLWEGCLFRLKIRQVDGYRNYDMSDFDKPAPLFDDDEKMEKIWASQHSLQEFLSPSKYKSYDDIKNRMNKVSGIEHKAPEKKAEPKATRKVEAKEMAKVEIPTSTDDEDDTSLDYFKNLAKE